MLLGKLLPPSDGLLVIIQSPKHHTELIFILEGKHPIGAPISIERVISGEMPKVQPVMVIRYIGQPENVLQKYRNLSYNYKLGICPTVDSSPEFILQPSSEFVLQTIQVWNLFYNPVRRISLYNITERLFNIANIIVRKRTKTSNEIQNRNKYNNEDEEL